MLVTCSLVSLHKEGGGLADTKVVVVMVSGRRIISGMKEGGGERRALFGYTADTLHNF